MFQKEHDSLSSEIIGKHHSHTVCGHRRKMWGTTMYDTLEDGVASATRAKSAPDTRTYALGYSEDEFSRLKMQPAFFHHLTQDVLSRAGLRQGMHVLDLGCGVGDVSLVAAELVGPSGLVLGVDRSVDAVRTAKLRATAEQCHWVRFAAADLDTFDPEQTFDAIIGRLIPTNLREPAVTLRRLRKYLRPGGVVTFLGEGIYSVAPPRPSGASET